MINAANSCQKQGLDYFVSFVTDFSRQDDFLERFLRDNQLKFFPEPVIYLGRAQGFDPPRILTDYHPNTCNMNPYLSPDLDMFACCDGGNQFKETDFLLLGNLRDYGIEELFTRKENYILFHLIRTMGLTNIASYLGLKASEIVQYRKCELCEKLFNAAENLNTNLSQTMANTYVPFSLSPDSNTTLVDLTDGNLGERGVLALGFTNALYLDVDGNGRFDAPWTP